MQTYNAKSWNHAGASPFTHLGWLAVPSKPEHDVAAGDDVERKLF